MSSYNKVIVVGNLTRDLELRFTPQGTAVAEFGIAINETWKKDGQKQEYVSFFDCTLFGKSAEGLADYLKKGRKILVDGKLRQDRWEDEKTGQKRSKIKILVDRVTFLGGVKEGGSADAKGEAVPADTSATDDMDLS